LETPRATTRIKRKERKEEREGGREQRVASRLIVKIK
jgi:hypothetical protein